MRSLLETIISLVLFAPALLLMNLKGFEYPLWSQFVAAMVFWVLLDFYAFVQRIRLSKRENKDK